MLTKYKIFLLICGLFTAIGNSQNDISTAEKLLNSGNDKAAETLLLEHETELEAIELLGDIYSFRKNWDMAISKYEQLVKAKPNDSNYNFKLGGAMGMKAYYGSKFQAAMLIGDVKKYLLKAAELDPNHSESRRALVELYMQIPGFVGGSQTIAESYASELHRINELDGLLADAYIYKFLDYQKLAETKYEAAIKLSRRKPEFITRNYLNYELAEVSAIYSIELDHGQSLIQRYIKNYGYKDIKDPSWAYYRWAQIERLNQNQDVALNYIKKSLQIAPNFDKALIEKQKIQRM
ncbi:tetratricopeptide repeat protein [Christiangramia sp. LLG6405-1]|uniref:tetratricopeptide repeat protein n=1 Tax=Christiangramia sp. LLG6405-1 TaxID=3160832 RepID=UPI00386C013B